MDLFVILLCGLVFGSLAQQDTNSNEDPQDFAKAVLNAYDVNRSFAENVYTIFDILCPINCPDKNAHEIDRLDNNTNFWNAGKDDTNFSSAFSLRSQPQQISEAKLMVKNNVHKLRGCCSDCSCRADCVEQKNCCHVFETKTEKSDESEMDTQVIQECVYSSIRSLKKNRPYELFETIGMSYFMVSDCFSSDIAKETETKCKYPNPDLTEETLPVYSIVTERIYKNKFCAECNVDNGTVKFVPVIQAYDIISLIELSMDWATPEKLYALILDSQKLINLVYFPPPNIDLRQNACAYNGDVNSYGDECKANAQLDHDQKYFFRRACNMFNMKYKVVFHTYNNVFCFLLCYGDYFGKKQNCSAFSKSGVTGYSAILDYVGIQSGVPTEKETGPDGTNCKCTEYFDERQKMCRRLICPPGNLFNHCECIDFLKNIINLPLKIYIEINPQAERSQSYGLFIGRPNGHIQAFKKNLNRVMVSLLGPVRVKTAFLFRETSSTDEKHVRIHGALSIVFLGNEDNRKRVENTYNKLQEGVSKSISGIPVTISLGRAFDMALDPNATSELLWNLLDDSTLVVKSLEITENDIFLFKQSASAYRLIQTFNKLIFCKRVELQDGEGQQLRNSYKALGLPTKFLSYIFREKDNSMCLDDFKLLFLRNASYALGLCKMNVTYVLLVLLINLQ